MRKSLTKRCHFIVGFALLFCVGGCTVSKHKVELQGSTPALSDEVTDGRVTRAALRPDRPDIRITVNVPAFLMTLWQDGREVVTYHVGVCRKSFPITIGERKAMRIILNPAWVPPDSSWVRDQLVGERIPAADPRNPLGKIKIPLGDAYLIHEVESPADIGHLVSHGCVRMLTDDLFDLTERIARARSLGVTREEIEASSDDTERRVLRLNGSLPVDINGVLDDPGPWVYVTELAASSVNFTVYFWAESHQTNVLAVSDRVATGIKLALDRAQIDMPFPHTVVLFHDATGSREGDIAREKYLRVGRPAAMSVEADNNGGGHA
jgi:hypothetical protein